MKYRTVSRPLAAVLLSFALAGCAPAQGAAAPEVEAPGLTVTDMKGNVLTLDQPARRIVTLAAGDCEILCAIGGEDLLAGRGEYCDYPASVSAVPVVQSGSETNLEQILALSPDIVVANVMDQTEEQFDALCAAGVPVALTDANTVSEVYDNIRLLGAVAGRTAEADALIKDMEARFAALKKQSAGREPLSAYYEVSPLEYGLWTAGTGSFLDEIGSLSGLTNAFSDAGAWAEVSEEQVLARNPEVIVTVSMYFGEGPTPAEEICGRPGWEGVSAVRDGRVFTIDGNAAARPGPRLADAAEALYALLEQAEASDAAA